MDIFKGEQSAFAKEIRAFAAQCQAIEDAAFVVYVSRTIDAALAGGFSATLDHLGDLLGELRYGRGDADYAIGLKVKTIINSSQGAPETIISAISALAQTDEVTYDEYYPASIVVTFKGTSAPVDTLAGA